MAAEAKQTCYEGSSVQSFQFYLEHSGEHKAILKFVHDILPEEFKRIGAGKSSLDVLGVGSGGGEVDAQMLALLQSTLPTVPITADIVEGSSQLTDNFKALVAKTPNLQKIPFAWHIMNSEDYERQVKAKGDMKKFDFIHMIQEYRSSSEVIASLKGLGLKYEEHVIPNSFDITECFDPSSKTGERLLNFMTARDHFHESFTPEIRAGMLDLLRNKCSTEKDGRVFFDSTLRAILVSA